MIELVSQSNLMPLHTEAHVSWMDLFYSDIYPTYRHPPGIQTSWTLLPPEHWTRHHVCDWLQYCCDSYKLDATYISFSHFNVSGVQLCSMTKEDFIEAAGLCGQHLYSLLQDIRSNGLSWLDSTQITRSPCRDDPPRDTSPDAQTTPQRTLTVIQGENKAGSKPTATKKQKSHSQNRTGMHNSHLWEFLRDLLLSPEDNSGILDWEDQEQGIFRVVKSDALAQMWGKRKHNDRMNYEKLSRALRHYYKTGILERVDRRLVYKFGKNAHGWH